MICTKLIRFNYLLKICELCDFHAIHPNLPAQSPSTKNLSITGKKHQSIKITHWRRTSWLRQWLTARGYGVLFFIIQLENV
jgi:hypothetical protein